MALKKVQEGKPDTRKSAPVARKREAAASKGRKFGGLAFLTRTRGFLEDVLKELKKVHWPTRREIVIYTAVVLVSVAMVGVVIWIFDSILSQLLGLIIS